MTSTTNDSANGTNTTNDILISTAQCQAMLAGSDASDKEFLPVADGNGAIVENTCVQPGYG